MSGHILINDEWWPRVKAHCSCGQWAGERDPKGIPGSLTKQYRAHIQLVAAKQEHVRVTSQVDWYERTGHCGACGEPGVFCVCRTPCGCAHLHECGSGLLADAADVFAVHVGDDQAGLFDLDGEKP